MRDPEKDFQKARSAIKRGESSSWIACYIASHYVGKRDGNTALFAEFLQKDVATVYYYCRCYEGYKLAKKPSKLRKQLSPGHFDALWATEYDPEKCQGYLERAVAENMTAKQLREHILIDNDVPPKPPNMKGWEEKGWSFIEDIKDNEKHEEALSLFRALLELVNSESITNTIRSGE